jgi:acyl-CoA synthetase (AMP-forming)/AMP-acid ligase II
MQSPHAGGTTLLDALNSAADDGLAVVVPEQDIHVTYASLRRQVEDLARGLAAAGIGRGDRVSMALPNGLPAIVSFLSAAAAGTAAPLNPAYTEDEFRFFLADTGARVLLLPPTGADAARRAAGDRVRVLTVTMDDAGLVTLDGPPGRGAAPSPSLDDVALILHTSGSTGTPKRVPLTHANLSISANNIARAYSLTTDDVALCVMPLFHVHGLVASTLAPLASGGTIVVPPSFSPLSFWRIAEAHRVTWYSAVPTMHQLLLARHRRGAERPAGARGLRFIRSCSASLPPAVMADLEAAFGAPVVEAYGMTEAAHQMSSNPLPPGERRPGSVGLGTDVRVGIMDAAGGLLPAGERGEVVIAGPNVMSGYENNPEANASAFASGWFRTGDQGVVDADGYLTLVGRLKELINRGGEKISPREIDEVLLDQPEVAEAVCFGVPHQTWGEEVEAAVVLREAAAISEAELIARCRDRLADYKRPKRIHFTDVLPRTATGKIQRRVVAAAFQPKSP